MKYATKTGLYVSVATTLVVSLVLAIGMNIPYSFSVVFFSTILINPTLLRFEIITNKMKAAIVVIWLVALLSAILPLGWRAEMKIMAISACIAGLILLGRRLLKERRE